jgi:hypothetical protein
VKYQDIDRFMQETGLAEDPAFDDLNFLVEPINSTLNGKTILGLYYRDPARDKVGTLPAHTIHLPEDADYQTLLHELGHRHGDHYYKNMSEQYAEDYRFDNQYLLPVAGRVSESPVGFESDLIPSNARLVYDHDYGINYSGKTEQCTTKVTVNFPDQLFSSTWITDDIANTVKNQIQDQGGQALSVKIYEDTSPTWQTVYYVVMTAAPAPVPRGAVGFPFPWAIVVPLILAVLVIVTFTWLIIEIKDINWGSPAGVFVSGLGIALLGVGAILVVSAMGGAFKKGREIYREVKSATEAPS